MSLRDRDLISIQEARHAIERASEAQKKFAAFSQEQVDAIVEACAAAATEAGEQLARLAVEETGYGNVADKIIKNRLASVDVPRAIRGIKTVGIIREDREKGILEIAEPVGVVAAVIPSTNPTSTTIYKTLISLKSRNAVVLSPHPTAMRCICEAVSVLTRAALKMGAPENLIVCLSHPTTQGTQELMRHRLTGVILATGGTGLVRAAYSSGRPAFGVGPGNVPAMIERTANVRKAVADILAGKTFDYGTICSSEQAIVAEEAVREQALEECQQQGAYFLTEEEIQRLGALVFLGGAHVPNTQVVGRPATMIAEMAGIKVPATTRVLIAKLEGVGRDVPLSGEKLSPILAFYSAPNLAAGIELCVKLLHHGGLGHTCAMHSQSEAAVKQYGLAVPAFRVVVNTSAVHGSIGYSTNLFPAMTLGCGSPGGNITSDNIGPQHLMNVKRVAWESRVIEHRTVPADQRLAGSPMSASPSRAQIAATAAGVGAAGPAAVPTVGTAQTTGDAATPDRETIARVVERVLAARGIPRGDAQSRESSQAAPTSLVAQAATAPIAGPTASMPTLAAAAAVPACPSVPAVRVPHSSGGEMAVVAAAFAGAGGASSAGGSQTINVVGFVSENEVRVAISQGKKIYIGPKTILTPSARDLGGDHEIFVVTDIVPAPSKKSRAAS
ncbi:MAG TPA: aldehyde dehydrogenase family protein [Candidatus Limnocylindria bacterium]|nr:aldehyde dehydrogenase family protein [Candidatus Limnocylindria bacterium]